MKINNPAKSIRRAAGLAAAIAAMLLRLFAASCGDGGENGSPDKTGGTETETEQVSGTDVAGENARLADISLYTVVYPSDAGEAVKTMAVNLYKALEVKTGKTIKIKDDWVMPGGNKDNDDYEILIGGTNRSATVNLTGSVLCNDFLIAASGNKIVIFANTEAPLEACAGSGGAHRRMARSVS